MAALIESQGSLLRPDQGDDGAAGEKGRGQESATRIAASSRIAASPAPITKRARRGEGGCIACGDRTLSGGARPCVEYMYVHSKPLL